MGGKARPLSERPSSERRGRRRRDDAVVGELAAPLRVIQSLLQAGLSTRVIANGLKPAASSASRTSVSMCSVAGHPV